jgi:hypothetical protein
MYYDEFFIMERIIKRKNYHLSKSNRDDIMVKLSWENPRYQIPDTRYQIPDN